MNYKFFAFLLGTLWFFSCKNNDALLRKSIIGTWDVYASEMNDKPNGLMKDGYFVFTDDNLVISNLFSENQSTKFVVENNKLMVDGEEKLDFDIVRLDQDTLFLDGKISFYHMKYFLVKRK